MDLLTLTLNKNHLWTGLSFVGLGTFTYLTNRYLTNTKETSNQTYYKPCEVIKGIPNLTILNNTNTNNNNTNNITYIFWNGDMNSTYILLDLLLQDTIIQPLYIERYTIIKALEKDTLDTIMKNENNNNKNNKNNTNGIQSNSNKKYESYLKNIVLLKKTQDYELKQLEVLRLMIVSKYPEFRNNFLPTIYITSITKDLEMTSHFFNIIKEIKPLYCDGIDFIEQVLRYIKYSGYIKNRNENNKNNNVSRIILGCNKDYKNYDLVLKLNHKNTNNIVFLDIPLKEIDNIILKQRCNSFFSNDIMMYFLSK